MKTDDLSVGMYVAICRTKEAEEDTISVYSMWGMAAPSRKKPCDGMPLKIEAISLPFVAVSAMGVVTAIDSRDVEFVRLDKRYVEAVLKKKITSKVIKQKPEPGCCPRCGDKLRTITCYKPLEVKQERTHCPTCGFEPPGEQLQGVRK